MRIFKFFAKRKADMSLIFYMKLRQFKGLKLLETIVFYDFNYYHWWLVEIVYSCFTLVELFINLISSIIKN